MRNSKPVLNIAVTLLALITISITALAHTPVKEIPFQYEMEKIILPISINGSKAIRCILDTGMVEGIFLMDPAAGKELNLKYATTNVMLRGGGSGTATASMAMGATFTLADVSFENQRVIVLNKSGPLARAGVVGVVGASIFKRFVVQIDIEKKMLRLYKPDEFDSKDAGESFELALTRTKPYIKASINIDGERDLPVTLVIDTGANSTLMFTVNKEKGIEAPSKSVDGVVGRGVGGELRGKVGRSKKLTLGKYELRDTLAHFYTEGIPGGKEGLIGMGLMERFLVTFDYTGKRMFLKPNIDFNKPFEFSMLGMSVLPDKNGALSVQSVFDGSAALEAGIEKGDIVISIDKKRLDFAQYARLLKSLTTPGQNILVEIERKGIRHEKSLKLKRLI